MITEIIKNIRDNIPVPVGQYLGAPAIDERFDVEPDVKHMFFCDQGLINRMICNNKVRGRSRQELEITYVGVKNEKLQDLRDQYADFVCDLGDIYNISEARRVSGVKDSLRPYVTSFFVFYY